MNPLVIAGALVGAALLYNNHRNKQKRLAASSGNGDTYLPPDNGTNGGGPNGDGNPDLQNDGFVLAADCNHMQVVNEPKTAETIQAFYRTNSLGKGGLQFGAEAGAADAHTRAFFSHYFGSQSPNCLPAPDPGNGGALASVQPGAVITGPYGEGYVLPAAAPLAQKLMYSFIFAAMTSNLLQDQRWTEDVAANQMAQLVSMLKSAGASEADWDATFQGTVPMPNALKPDAPGGVKA